MKVHFIAIGGAAMHNLALALHHKGYEVSGSDDEINEPSRSRLEKAGLLPAILGWNPQQLSADLDAVILGMHARADNPELIRAHELGLRVYSYPEYLYEQSKNKRRFVIGGSHGKTSITAMVLHVMQMAGLDFDYMVGSQLEGFERMVRLSESAPLIVLEGDEYLSSPIDRRPKFHLYHADVALLSGIAWDHINVFPTFDEYVEQFRIFVDMIPEKGCLIYCREDTEVVKVVERSVEMKRKIPYGVPAYRIENGTTILETAGGEVPLMIFGRHNLMNLEGARYLCREAGISDEKFYQGIASFKGAARRLELFRKEKGKVVFRDFAHSPSKLRATLAAVREQFDQWNVVACMELHTFSSLSEQFLSQYAGTMDEADQAFVYFNPQTIAHKKLQPIGTAQVREAFGNDKLRVFSDPEELAAAIRASVKADTVILMMSSGTFDGVRLDAL
ncbi:MAG: peptidoglycan synthetase [Bacteroidia bacterium]|nr:peptidoglycan synthetase [Bacteroidia bacterium]